MNEIKNNPFRPGDLVGESNYSNVWTHPGSDLVVKQPKPDNPIFYTSTDEAKTQIERVREDIRIAQERAREWGFDPESITPTDFVLHANPEGKIVYSRVQPRIKNAHTLAEEKGKFLGYPTKTLNDLKGIFEMNLHMVKNEGTGVDVVGSSKRPLPLFIKGLRLAFPLLTSGNITIDPESNVHFIDYEVHRPLRYPFGRKKKLGIKIEAFGCKTSIVALNAILKFREVTGIDPKKRASD